MKNFYFAILCVLLGSCSENAVVVSTLDRVEAVVDEFPDSALLVIRSLDPAAVRKGSSQARYALLYSQALDKTGIDVQDDSLIRIASDYYRKHGMPKECFLSTYYRGRVAQNSGDYRAAVQLYLDAEEYLPLLGNDYFAGLLYSSIADLNLAQGSYERALYYYTKAYDRYTLCGKERHRINALSYIARVYYMQDQTEEALKHYELTLDLAKNNDYADFEVACLRCLMGIYTDQHDISRAKEYLYWMQALTDDLSPNDCAVVGQLYLYESKPDSAEYYLRRTIREAQDDDCFVAGHVLLAEAEAQRHRYRDAYEILRDFLPIKDSMSSAYVNNSVAELELHSKNERLAYGQYRLQVKQKIIYAVIIAAILSVCGIVYLYNRRYLRQQEQLAEYFSLIDNLQASSAARAPRLSALFDARFRVLKELAMTYYEYGNSPSLTKKVQAILSEKILDAPILEDLENTLNLEYEDVIKNFRTEYPRSNSDFIELLCLIYAGFSPQEICVITNETLPAIYMRKSRLKKKIAASNLPNKDMILHILS